jgi:protein O-GlcNAc transferase
LKRALVLDSQLADAHYTLGVIYWQKGDFAFAAEQLRAAIAAKPDYAEAHYLLGSVLKQMNQLPEAEISLREAIRLAPDLLGAHTNLAAVLQQMGDSKGAELEREIAAKVSKATINRQTAVFNTNSGIRLLNSEDVDGAITHFQTAIKLAPDYAPAHFYLSRALQRKGMTAEATAEYRRATELDPEIR